jgi:hypothetical protein
LIEKYNNLAREALSSGDKILSENYFQHADHFTRILNDQEILKKTRFSVDNKENKDNKIDDEVKEEKDQNKVTSKEEVEDKVAVSK